MVTACGGCCWIWGGFGHFEATVELSGIGIVVASSLVVRIVDASSEIGGGSQPGVIDQWR